MTKASRLWPGWRRVALATLIGFTVVSASYAAYCGVLRYVGNFHVVEEGLFYRSAQLDKAGFELVIKDHGIRSILNLRGASNRSWYRDEVEVSKSLGVEHYDFRLSADRIVTPQQIYEILNIIRTAPKPILVHCSAGSDRAGLVSALYLFELDGTNPNDAAKELSLVYGHFPYLTSKTGAMDQSFWTYARSAQQFQER